MSQLAGVRQLLNRLLQSWRMADASMGDVQLLASEVTANAIRYGQSPVTLIARYDGQRVRIEVGDGSRELPQRRQPAATDEGGRGMFLVDAMAADWGVLPTVNGKRVWFEVELGEEPS
jgi:anti-sigma regulatory factor (Ser/Thr protein kinase)